MVRCGRDLAWLVRELSDGVNMNGEADQWDIVGNVGRNSFHYTINHGAG